MGAIADQYRKGTNLANVNYQSFADLPTYEQRSLPRWKSSHKAFYRADNRNQLVKTKVVNLNFKGAGLYGESSVCPGDRVELRISLGHRRNFETKALVMWTRRGGKHTLMGVAFDRLDFETKGLILGYSFNDVRQ